MGRVLALALLGLGGALLLAEAVAGFWLERRLASEPPLSSWQRSFDPAVGDNRVLPRPGQHVGEEDPPASAFYTLRRFGTPSAGASPESLRILALGEAPAVPGVAGSVTAAARAERLGGQLGRSARPVEIALAGLPGDSSSQQLIRLVAILARWRPDVVVSLGGAEDLRFAVHPFFRQPDNVLAAPVFAAALQTTAGPGTPFLPYRERRLIACRAFCLRTPSALELLWRYPASMALLRPAAGAWPASAAPVPEADLARAAAIWRRNGESMQALAALNGARFLLVLQPSLAGAVALQEKEESAAATRFYALLRRECRTLPACLDLSGPGVPDGAVGHWATPYAPNSEGQRRIADRIFQRLGSLAPGASDPDLRP